MSGKTDIRTARVYDNIAGSAGARLLVDRIWPRGIRKEDLNVVRPGVTPPIGAPSL